MCEPVTLSTAATATVASSAAAGTAAAAAAGTAAAGAGAAAASASVFSAAMFGSAATATTAATSGLFGVGGAFAAGQTLGTLGMLGALASGYASYQQADTTKRVAQYNAEVSSNQADYQRKVAEIEAQDITRKGEEEAMMMGRKARQLAAEQRVALGAHGLDLTFGTAADLQEQTNFFAQSDINRARANTQQQAYARRLAGQNAGATAEAQAMSYSLQSQATTPWLAGAGTMLTGLGSVSNKWYNQTDLDAVTRAQRAMSFS